MSLHPYDLQEIQLPKEIEQAVRRRQDHEKITQATQRPEAPVMLTLQGHAFPQVGAVVRPTTISTVPIVTATAPILPAARMMKGRPSLRSASAPSTPPKPAVIGNVSDVAASTATPATVGLLGPWSMSAVVQCVSPKFRSLHKSKFTKDLTFLKDVLTRLDDTDTITLRKDFVTMSEDTDGEDTGAVTLQSFVAIVWHHVQAVTASDRTLPGDYNMRVVAALEECFHQIDVNRTGVVTYEEFVNFLVTLSTEEDASRVDYVPTYKRVDGLMSSNHVGAINKIRYSSHLERLMVTEDGQKQFALYSVDTLKPVATSGLHQGAVLDVHYSPEFDMYFSVAADRSLYYWDGTLKRLVSRVACTTMQNSVTFSVRHRLIFTGGMNGIVSQWQPQTIEPVFLRKQHADAVTDLLDIPVLDLLASASADSTVGLWDMHTGTMIRRLYGHTKSVNHLEFLPLHRMLVTAGSDHDALVWNPLVNSLVTTLSGHCYPLVGCSVIPDSSEIVTSDLSGQVRIWDVRTFKCVQSMSVEGFDAAFHPMTGCTGVTTSNKRVILAGSRMHVLQAESADDATLTDTATAVGMGFSDHSLSFCTAGGRSIKIWDGESGKLLRSYRDVVPADISRMSVSSDGRLCIVGDCEGGVAVINYATGQKVKALPGHIGSVQDMSVAGQYVVTGGADGVIRVCNKSRCKIKPKSASSGNHKAVVVPTTKTGDARLMDIIRAKLFEAEKGGEKDGHHTVEFEGGVIEGMVELHHQEAVRWLEQSLEARWAPAEGFDPRTRSPSPIQDVSKLTAVFANECRTDEASSWKSGGVHQSRSRRKRSSARGDRTGIVCVTACPVDAGLNILTFRQAKQYEKLMQDRLRWGRHVEKHAKRTLFSSAVAGHDAPGFSTMAVGTPYLDTPKPTAPLPEHAEIGAIDVSDDSDTASLSSADQGFAAINRKSTFNEIAGSFRPQSSASVHAPPSNNTMTKTKSSMTAAGPVDAEALKFSDPLLVASACFNNNIVVWDATPSRRRPIALCRGHASDVLALQFCYPYPILLSADVSGVIVAWDFSRRSLQPDVIAFAHNKHVSGQGRRVQSAVVSLAWDPEGLEVFAADEFGFVKTFDMRPVVESLVRKETMTRRQSKRQSMTTIRATFTPADDGRARTPSNQRTMGSPDDDAFGFGMDPKGPTIAKQSYYHHRPCSRATDDTFMSTLQGTTVKAGPVHRLLQISEWKAHQGSIQSLVFVDSDCLEDAVLVTSGIDQRVRVWNTTGKFLGCFLHGPNIIAKRRILEALDASPEFFGKMCWIGCGSTLSDSAIAYSQSPDDPQCQVVNGSHAGIGDVGTSDARVNWLRGEGHPSCYRQHARATGKGRRQSGTDDSKGALMKAPADFTGTLDFVWSCKTHTRVLSARQVIRSALLMQHIKRSGMLSLLKAVPHAPAPVQQLTSRADELIQTKGFVAADIDGSDATSVTETATAESMNKPPSFDSASVFGSQKFALWQRAQTAELQQYTEFIRSLKPSSRSRSSGPSSRYPSSKAGVDVDEALWAENDKVVRRHAENKRSHVRWMTSVERAWNKAGLHLRAGKAQATANAKVGGFVTGFAGQAVWDETVRPTTHKPAAPLPPSHSEPAARPKTTHRKLRVFTAKSGFVSPIHASPTVASPQRLVKPLPPHEHRPPRSSQGSRTYRLASIDDATMSAAVGGSVTPRSLPSHTAASLLGLH